MAAGSIVLAGAAAPTFVGAAVAVGKEAVEETTGIPTDPGGVVECFSKKADDVVVGAADDVVKKAEQASESAGKRASKTEAPPNPHARPSTIHRSADEIAENFGMDLIEKHGDPSKWKHQFTKSEPLTQRGARPGERKVYEVWEDEFGRKFEWHYEVDELGVPSVGKYVHPSTTCKPK
jgi:hypothetical protein